MKHFLNRDGEFYAANKGTAFRGIPLKGNLSSFNAARTVICDQAQETIRERFEEFLLEGGEGSEKQLLLQACSIAYLANWPARSDPDFKG